MWGGGVHYKGMVHDATSCRFFYLGRILRKSRSFLLNFSEAVCFVLSTVGIGTLNVEPIHQQLSDEYLFRK